MGEGEVLSPLKKVIFWLLLLLLLVLFVKNFFYEVFTVSQRSMEPTLNEGDLLLVSVIHYKFFKPKAGDVVVLVSPEGKLVVKRIEKINEGKIFVVGDNQMESLDSRVWGYIDQKKIVGKVILKLYPKFEKVN